MLRPGVPSSPCQWPEKEEEAVTTHPTFPPPPPYSKQRQHVHHHVTRPMSLILEMELHHTRHLPHPRSRLYLTTARPPSNRGVVWSGYHISHTHRPAQRCLVPPVGKRSVPQRFTFQASNASGTPEDGS